MQHRFPVCALLITLFQAVAPSHVVLFSWNVIHLGPHVARASDTDGDGLLDLLDAPGFNANASGAVSFAGLGIEDLDGASQLVNATSLELQLNRIAGIDQGDFAGLNHLTHLYLSGNQITSIDEGDFDGLSALRDLFLFDNEISDIDGGAFRGLTQLQRLILDHNELTTIESGDFEGLHDLPWLSLRSNQLTTIRSDDFDGLHNLQFLHLSGNPVRIVEDGAFSGLENLASLELRGIPEFTELNLAGATLDKLFPCEATPYGEFGFCVDGEAIESLRLDGSLLSQGAFHAILEGTASVSIVTLVDIDFSDGFPVTITELLSIEDLSEITVDSRFYQRYAHELDVFDALPGKRVAVVPEPAAFVLSVSATGVWILRILLISYKNLLPKVLQSLSARVAPFGRCSGR